MAPGVTDVMFIQILHQVRVLYPHSGELLGRFSGQRSPDILRSNGQGAHFTCGGVLFELAVGNGFHV